MVLATSLVMIAAFGGFLWKMNGMSDDIDKKSEEALKEERDIATNGKKVIDTVKDIDIIPLYTSGDSKNVVTINYDSLDDVYSSTKSADAERMITDIKERSPKFTPEKALWAYNPYGTNPDSMYVYFNTNGRCYCKYTISVKEDNIPDFTRTLINGDSSNLSTEHEYQIMGLVPGKVNYITLRLFNKSDELSKTLTYRIRMPKSKIGSELILKNRDGRSKTTISNGLYTVFTQGKKRTVKTTKIVTKKVKKNGKKVTKRVKKTVKKTVRDCAILLYDNSGVLRGELPLDGYCGRNIERVYDNIAYAVSDDKIIQVNDLGQVINVSKINGYKQSGEFVYDGFGNFYVIATPRLKNSVKNSKIVKVELESGTVSEALDMNTLLPKVYKDAAAKAKKASVNWIDVNSIQVVGTNTLLISSEKLSSIFKVSNVNSLMPKINYIISDKSIWSKYKALSKKVLKKALKGDATPEPAPTPIVKSILNTKKPKAPEAFASQAGQNAITYNKKSSDKYDLTMLNNNYGLKAGKAKKSYYYRYRVDEAARTYILSAKKDFDQTKKDGNIEKSGDVYVYNCSDSKKIVETDLNGKLIKEFKLANRAYRVYKNDWKGFWFY